MRIQRYDSLELRDFRTPFTGVPAAVEAAPEAVAPPPPQVFSQAELEAAKDVAFKTGHAEGVQAGIERVVNETHARDNDMAIAIQKIANDIGKLDAVYQSVLTKQGTELTQMVTLIARKIAGDALQANAEAMVESMVVRCLPVLIYKPRVIIEVHADIIDKVESRIAALLESAGFLGDLTVRVGANIARSDIKIDWAAGFAERSTEALWSEVTHILNEIAMKTHDPDPTPNHETNT